MALMTKQRLIQQREGKLPGSRKVLIVEDYEDIANIYSFILQKSGYDVQIAKDGKDALEKVLEFQPDAILLDIMIPYIDGIEVLKAIRTRPEYKDVQPRVLITSNVLQQDISDQAALHGADGYVVKANITNQDLATIVDELFAKEKKTDTPDA